MKRRVDETTLKEGGGFGFPVLGGLQTAVASSSLAAAYTTNSGVATVKVISEGMQSRVLPLTPPSSYGSRSGSVGSGGTPADMAAAAAAGGGSSSVHRNPNNIGAAVAAAAASAAPPPNSITNDASMHQQQHQQQSPGGGGGGGNFQRLKVEDALSYLDLVKFKFSSKPQVYNDFLDIMKEFKSQSIDTPGVIQRVSNLFKGFPELIVGFNTFLPPGYKIEVQRSDQGYAFQVSVSMPSPTGGTLNSSDPQHKSAMILTGSGTINMSVGGGGVGVGASVVTSSSSSTSALAGPAAASVVQQPAAAVVAAPHVAAAAPAPAAAAPVVQQQQQQHHHPSAGGGGAVASAAGGDGHRLPNSYGLSLSAAQAAVNHALQGHTDTPQNQPVEFNHAINYVNKIKNRFQGQPEKYKKFLEILHTYQKEQRTLKDGSTIGPGGQHLTEKEVYSQVAKLFENQSDLLAEFGQFLPDATSHIGGGGGGGGGQTPIGSTPIANLAGSGVGGGAGAALAPIDHANSVKKPPNKPYRDHHMIDRHLSHNKPPPGHIQDGRKRSPSYPLLGHRDAPPPKKHKMSTCRDITISEAGKYGTLNDYAFFDKVRKAVRSSEVYGNFLRCLTLFNQEIISKSELVQLVTPFLNKFPELLRWLREFVGQNDAEAVPLAATRPDRPQGDHALEIDLATAKRLGASYCVIPKAQEGLKCSGRTQLCREVLNDQWVSFPTWSEDSTFVSSRKTQYEEYMYRCEDERFELDVVIETNASTIRVLEGVNKKLNRMSADDVARYHLDDTLGGQSPTQHQRALRRIYGDKAPDIIDGLKRNPAVAVPVVLRRLKAKEEEWREAQKGFNKIWREQNDKFYLKSLDHQGINFKQTDVKALRSKSLFNEIETIFDERHEQNEEGSSGSPTTEPVTGPHLVLPYRDRSILDDASNLLIHHLKRQTGVQKGEKRRIKHLLRQFLPDLFFHPRQQLSDDEREDDDDKDDCDESPGSSPREDFNKSKSAGGNGASGSSPGKSPAQGDGGSVAGDVEVKTEVVADAKDDDVKVPLHAQVADPDEAYTLFMANNNWYIFLRLHAILCERLARMYERAVILGEEEVKVRVHRKESTAIALRLKPKPQIEVDAYYPAFLDMVRNLLDGNMESNTYEDTLREMFGIHAYIAFTLDKVVSYAVRQLQHCVAERPAMACTELFLREQKRGAAGGACATAHRRAHAELAYQRAAEKAVQEENCFKIYIYKRECRMTVELLDTEPEESGGGAKKVEEAKKWNSYKEHYAECGGGGAGGGAGGGGGGGAGDKARSPVYLNRNLRLYRKRISAWNNSAGKVDGGATTTTASAAASAGGKDYNAYDELERKLNERALERNQSNRDGYEVSDETQCKFNVGADSKIMFLHNRNSFIYKISAFSRAKKSHPGVTKSKDGRFREWLKDWCTEHVSDGQHKQCMEWLMGRGDNVVPNKTRILTDNDVSRTPYAPYNRYRVERLARPPSAGGGASGDST